MKLGIIGLGLRMNGLLPKFREANPDLEIVGIIDHNHEKALASLTERERENVKFYCTVEELVKGAQPDALAIATNCDSHAQFAIEAAPFGLPIYLEKPVAVSIQQAINLERAFEQSTSKVLVSFPLRATPLFQKAKSLVDRGAVGGRIEHVNAFNYVSYGSVYFDSWYRDQSITQGLFLQKATHDLDYLISLVGAPVSRVAAMTSTGRVFRDTKTITGLPDPFSYYYDEIGTPEEGMNEDSSSVLLEFANGTKGLYSQVFFTKRTQGRGATLAGFKGTLSFDFYKDAVTVQNHQEPTDETHKMTLAGGHFGGDDVITKNFIAVIRGEAEPLAPLSAGLESVYACLAAKESAQKHCFVQVRQLGDC